MILDKNVIFHFVRRNYVRFPEAWKHKFNRVRVVVNDNVEQFGEIKGEPGKDIVLGEYYVRKGLIEFYLPSLRSYMVGFSDIYEGLRKVESVVEHEMLHAIGMNHRQLDQYNELKKKIYYDEEESAYVFPQGVKIKDKGRLIGKYKGFVKKFAK